MRTLIRALRYALPYRHLVVSSVLLVVLSSVVSLLEPWPLAILVDNVLGGQPLSGPLAQLLGPIAENRYALLVLAVLAGLGVTILFNSMSVAQNFVDTTLDQRMVLDCRSDLFQHAQRLSLAFHDQSRTGMLMYTINYSASAVGAIFTAILALAQSLITLVGMFWVTTQIHVHLALLAMVVVPFITYAVRYYTKRIEPRLLEVRGMEGESLSIVHEAMAMLRVIVAFGREDHEYQRFRSQGESAVKARVHLTVRQTLFSLGVNTSTAAGNALVLGVGAVYVLRGELSVGDLLVITSYVASMYQPLQAITATAASLQEQYIQLRAAFALLAAVPEVTEAPDAIALDEARGGVRFDSIYFSYPGRTDTLKDISFEARAGQVVCIVGPTGAGKSTLVSLIPRFYDPQRGRLFLDGIDVRQLTLTSLRQQISIVLQEPLLFAGTISDNIRYGRLDASEEEIIEAAKAANAHDFISRLPDGYETTLGERGSQLSGGERQRIAVARAFLKDAPILILDEPTSSIDSKTEGVILDALDRLMEGRTTFIIAHRLSTIRSADTILVLNHGELVEAGSHAELMERDGLYRQLYEMQIGTRQHEREPVMPVMIGV
jgi:ABC-type multidrug transport system fused ATPase/permease subunit